MTTTIEYDTRGWGGKEWREAVDGVVQPRVRITTKLGQILVGDAWWNHDCAELNLLTDQDEEGIARIVYIPSEAVVQLVILSKADSQVELFPAASPSP